MSDPVGGALPEQQQPEELKPCPFCGGEAKVFGPDTTINKPGFDAGCLDLSCPGWFQDCEWRTRERATAAWNRRVSSGTANPQPDLERLRAIAEKATPGPWRLDEATTTHRKGSPACGELCGKGGVPISTRTLTTPEELARDAAQRRGWAPEKYAEKEFHTFPAGYVKDVLAASGEHVICLGHDYDDYGSVSMSDAAHIAAFSPSVCLSLLDEIQRLREGAPQTHKEEK